MGICRAPLKLPNRDKNSSLGWDIVPCGKCMACIKRRISSWSFRLQQQSKNAESAHFITFTYENTPKTANALPTLRKRDFQNFLKRLRKQLPEETYTKKDGSTGKRTSLKYYYCGEYGTKTHRPHYHAIMFNIPNQHLSQLEATWSHGHVQIDPCNMATIAYTLGYLKKPFKRLKPSDDIYDDRERHFSNMSKGLGKDYINRRTIKYHKSRLESFVRQPGGIILPLPRYYRDKIFTEEEIILINQATHEARQNDFEKLFNNSYKHLLQWQENQDRLQQKLQKQERTTL